MDNFTYYTDGAATMENKNGKYLRDAGGWAYILLKNDVEVSSQSGGCPLTTNNEMELYAIYASIKDFIDNSKEGDTLTICSDSAYCIGIYTQWIGGWQKRGWRKSDGKPIQNLEIVKATWNLINQIDSVSFKKVKGHSKDKLNAKVDKLAVDAKKVARNTGKTIEYNQKDEGLLGNKGN